MTDPKELSPLFVEIVQSLNENRHPLEIRRALRNFRRKFIKTSVHDAEIFLKENGTIIFINMSLRLDTILVDTDKATSINKILDRMESIEWVLGYVYDNCLAASLPED